MQEYKYLIIGGGMTADAAVQGIREVDPSGSIGIISKETQAPYKRPPLSKGLWKGEEIESIRLNSSNLNVHIHLNRTVVKLDPVNKRVVESNGEEYSYSKLLIATGGIPRRLKNAPEDIIYFRTYDDYAKLQSLVEQKKKFIIIGGGFIGSEIAAALRLKKKQVTMIFPETGIGAAIFPADLSEYLNNYYRRKGVDVLVGEMVEIVTKEANGYMVKTKSGKTITGDAVIAGLGLIPDVSVAQSAGVEVNNGIIVNDYLRTNKEDIFAAGDVANFFNPALGKRMRVEHEDNALTMGKIAGQNMAGKQVPYHHLPFFYSDLFDLGYEAVGETDSKLEKVADWTKPFKQGVVYYLQEGRVRGVLLWGIFEQVPHARALIAERGPFSATNLKNRLPVEDNEEEVLEERFA
jgi:3-phenylpropionate/trans-cinnamate dioxygenase ferredoxin reductase subunit